MLNFEENIGYCIACHATTAMRVELQDNLKERHNEQDGRHIMCNPRSESMFEEDSLTEMASEESSLEALGSAAWRP